MRRCCPTSGSRWRGLPTLICSRRVRPGVRQAGGNCCVRAISPGVWSRRMAMEYLRRSASLRREARYSPNPWATDGSLLAMQRRHSIRFHRMGSGARWRAAGRQPGQLRQSSTGMAVPLPPTASDSLPTTRAISGSGTHITRTSGDGPACHSGNAGTASSKHSRLRSWKARRPLSDLTTPESNRQESGTSCSDQD